MLIAFEGQKDKVEMEDENSRKRSENTFIRNIRNLDRAA
jgi:hypothetical protein